MCICFFCLNPTNIPNISFVIAFNREEDINRKTAPFANYTEDQHIFAGRDLKSHGTWLGINIKTGLMVFLTNYRLQYSREGKSRGALTYNFLKTEFLKEDEIGKQNSNIKIQRQMSQILKEKAKYGGFNLVVYNIKTQKLFYICSEWNHGIPIELKEGKAYGLCNSDINTIWPKTNFGVQIFKNIIKKWNDQTEPEQIFENMYSLCQNTTSFSKIDQDQSSIFVLPYKSEKLKTERMTKSTFLCVIRKQKEQKTVQIREITYQINRQEDTLHFKFIL